MTPEQQQAIEQLFLQYGKGVGSFVLARVGDAELAEEITAEVFLTVVRQYHQLRESPVGWLWSIVRTQLGRHFRRRGRFVSVNGRQLASSKTPADAVDLRETLASLQDALTRLSEEQQQIVGMKFFLGLRNLEIAAAMGLTASSVGVKIHRALKELRELLGLPFNVANDAM